MIKQNKIYKKIKIIINKIITINIYYEKRFLEI